MNQIKLDGFWETKDRKISVKFNDDDYIYSENDKHYNGKFSTEEIKNGNFRIINFSNEPKTLALWSIIDSDAIYMKKVNGEVFTLERII